MQVTSLPGPPPQAGPSRPRRLPEADLADRIVSMQRKQAGPGAVHASSRTRRPASPLTDEFSRSPRASGSRLFDPKSDYPLPKSPRPTTAAPPPPPPRPHAHAPQSDSHRGQRVQSPGAVARRDRDTPRNSEYSRGSVPDSGHRQLFDPSQPQSGSTTHVASGSGSSRHYQSSTSHSHSRSEHPSLSHSRIHDDGRSRRSDPSRTLFDPSQRDPIQFHGRIDAPSLSGSGQGSTRSFPRVNGRSKEEEMDRERERRKRKEGSERGMSKKKEPADARSKGSRSSEGSESFKDRERGKARSDGGVKAFLKDVYDKIKVLELELNEIHKALANDISPSVSRNADLSIKKTDSMSTSAWLDLIVKHKKLSDLHHEFLVRVFDPLVPSSLHQLTVRYNIPSRLWQSGFHLILERLRHAWMSDQPAALDLLTDLVYDAYKFYTDLLEDQTLANFRTAWIEALGDLARYRMAIATHQVNESKTKSPKVELEGDLVEDGDDSSGASIGAGVAQQWEVEDKETWRTTARDWYSMGITEKPGEGRLHHHLALLARDLRGQEPRALHHFTKSLTVTHAFESARESILPLFDSALQSQRSLPEATAMDLFVRLHGMLFTRIQLDDMPTVMSRFLERLEEDASLDGVSRKATITQVDWMLMATTNITALLQYGSGLGIIRKALAQEGAERRRQHASAAGDGEDEEDGQVSGESDGLHQTISPGSPLEPTLSFSSALELSFAILDHCLQHPRRQQGMTHVLNPYITLSLTFMATLFRQAHIGSLISTGLPWVRLVDFLNTTPDEIREEARLINGAPLPEDWCIRGMEWVGRRVYERGFWKAKGSGRGSGAMAQPKLGERFSSELDVLLSNFDSAVDTDEGVVDEIDGTDLTDGPVAVNQRRWRRVAWAAGVLVKHVDGLELVDGKVAIRGVLADKLAELEAERFAKMDLAHAPEPVRSMFDDDIAGLESDSEGEEDPELAVLRERRRHLRSLVNVPSSSTLSKSSRSHPSRGSRLKVIPGYTMLVFDTNVLLSSLSLFSKLVESGIWSIVVPLPVVTELDGLSHQPAPLGPSAKQAVTYLESRIRTHSLCLKIQTTKGNYLSDLLIRTEHHDRGVSLDERTMDDRILNIAKFQKEHFVDRSTILGARGADGEASKVVLVTFDRNLRLKARARGVDAADEKEMAGIMGKV